LTEEECSGVRDLAALEHMLHGRARRYLAADERRYLDALSEAVREGRLDDAARLPVPDRMAGFRDLFIRTVPYFKPVPAGTGGRR